LHARSPTIPGQKEEAEKDFERQSTAVNCLMSKTNSLRTGLDYDPQQGRFTQVDPMSMASSDLADPQTLAQRRR
jgi:hypothetical protein